MTRTDDLAAPSANLPNPAAPYTRAMGHKSHFIYGHNHTTRPPQPVDHFNSIFSKGLPVGGARVMKCVLFRPSKR